ncbi:multidrug efflux MFS transporter [Clostridium sp. YIM B02505]|uniref:Multidrug efflux MFS transporter n=1 Tax=Clostridium yunnanense TaxID=2800325 RepID=A0ABS1ESD4_9CLOT|nr:MDR family MFS transporter [Clostridium yunnanense]MBK1812225.1 multidrug efflux MFS transporter [Clostridium yunnanense]
MVNEVKRSESIVVIALILVLGAIAPMLDATMTNVAVNTIMKDLGAGVDSIQWVSTGYVLALGIIVPITGWAIEWIDGKKLYLYGLMFFLAGSVVASVSTSIGLLIAGRVIQGIGSGIIIPLLTTLIVRSSGGENLGSLMSIIGIPAVLAPILGPTFGGFIVNSLDWHWIFYINVPIVIISAALIIFGLPNFEPSKKGKKLDIPSIVLLGGSFTSFILGISKVSELVSGTSNKAVLPLIISVLLMGGYVAYAILKEKSALVSLKLFKIKNFSASTILLVMSGLTVNGVMFLLPLYLQNIRGLSVVWSGIYLISQGIGLLVSRSLVGKLTDKLGARIVVQVSVFIGIAGTLPFTLFTASTSNLWIILVLFIRGIAQGGLTIPVMSDSYNNVPKELISEATTATRMLQNIGGAIGTAILATIIQHSIGSQAPTKDLLLTSYHNSFVFTVVSLVVALIPAFFLTNNRKKEVVKA